MNVIRSGRIYLFFFISFVVISCGNPEKVDVSHIRLDLKVDRFDQDLSRVTPATVSLTAPGLKQKYGDFYEDYMAEMLSVASTADTSYYPNLRTVLSNKDYAALKEEVAHVYPSLEDTEKELTEAFKHVKYYFPKQRIPRLISYFSGFYSQVTLGNNYLGIGLDMFLGADSKFYPALRTSIAAYISRRFTPENITPRVMETYIREELYPERASDISLLSKMIYNGKVMYAMGACMPGLADSLKIGFTAKQMNWCKEYESDIWAYFLEENLLYEADYVKIQKYLTEAPFTPGIGEHNDSAPKLGIYAGWQIVNNYMERHPEITLPQLLAKTDYQEILTEARYRP